MAATGTALLALTLIAVVIYKRIDPETSALFPRCPFLSLTGLKCPGCGSQRAIHQLLNGNIIKALQYNALMVTAIPYMIFGAVSFLCKKGLYDKFYRGKAVWVVMVLIVVFWVFRNIFDF